MSLDSGVQDLASRIAAECKELWVALAGLAASPPGLISAFGGSAAPTGWLMCDGSAVSRSTYADLYTVLGNTYGAGDGSTTFNVPDLRVRTPIGAGTGVALGSTDGVAEGSRAARYGHSHTHTASSSASAVSAGTPAGSISSVSAGTPAGSVSSDSAGTPAGTVVSASAGTPSVSVSVADHADHQHYISSQVTNSVGDHSHTIPAATTAGVSVPNSGTGSQLVTGRGAFDGHNHGGTNANGAHNHSFGNFWSSVTSVTLSHSVTVTPSALAAHGHTFTGTALAAHGHTFTGTALGTHTHTFTGSALATHTHTITTTVDAGGAAVHPYAVVNYIIKT